MPPVIPQKATHHSPSPLQLHHVPSPSPSPLQLHRFPSHVLLREAKPLALPFTATRSNTSDIISMVEPEKGLSSSGNSEPKVSHDEKVGGETLEGSVEYKGGVVKELGGEGGVCNGKDVIMGSDVYIDGVCTHGSGIEKNGEVGCGGSVEGGEDLGKDLKSAEVGSGTKARIDENSSAVELDGVVLEREDGDQAVVGSGECDASLGEEALSDDRAEKKLGTGVSDSSGHAEVPIMEDVKSAEVGSGTEARIEEGTGAVESEKARSENSVAELDDTVLERETKDQAVVSSVECDASLQAETLFDDRAQKEVGAGITNSSGNIEVPAMEDVKSSEVGSGTEARIEEDSRAVESEEARSENAAAELDDTVLERETNDQAVVTSDESDSSLQAEALVDDRAQKEVGAGVTNSSGNIEVHAMADVKSAGVGSGTEAQLEDSRAVESEEAKSENAAVNLEGTVLERETRDQAVVSSDECDASLKDGTLFEDRAQKEVCAGVSDSSANIGVPITEDVGVDCIKALDAGALDHKSTNSTCGSALECSLTGSSVGGEHVECRGDEEDNQKDKNVIDHGTPEGGNDVTLDTLDESQNISNTVTDKLLDKEACIGDKVEVDEKLSANEEQPTGNDKVDDNSNKIQVVNGTEVATDKVLLDSAEKNTSSLQQCNEKMTASSLLSSDTGQTIADKDVGGSSALDVACSVQKEELNKDATDQPETESNKMMNDTAEVKGTSVSIGSERILDANATEEKDTQITGKGKAVPLGDGKEKLSDESNTRQNVDEQADISEKVCANGGQEIEEEFNEAEQRKAKDGKASKRALMKSRNAEAFHQARYSLRARKEGDFSISDMVWGKVRSHPWWPGQIFDPSDASERAKKHYKKDCHLVAYFGDKTFAWNEASQLKPFRTHFSSIEKQSTSESFHNAVDCALDEVTRRVECGLACSCIPKDTYETIRFQTVENAGIREEQSSRPGLDESLNASSFSPTKLAEYLKTLSELPTGGFDRLELAIAKAQLLAFYRFKGYSRLPELEHCGDLVNDLDNLVHNDETKLSEVIEHATPEVKKNEAGVGNLKSQSSSRPKRKHNSKDTMHTTKKERRLSGPVDGTPDSPDGDCWSDEKLTDNLVSPGNSKKRRAIDPYSLDSGKQEGRKTISFAKVSNTAKSSFKIGDCIRRVASQLTAPPPSLVKSPSSSDQSQNMDEDVDGAPENVSDVSHPTIEEAQKSNVPHPTIEEAQKSSTIAPTEISSLDELLSSLQWVAQEPHGEYSFRNSIISFFFDFRNSVVVPKDSGKEMLCPEKAGTKRKKLPLVGPPETFEFEDMNDTYWTDRVIDNGIEEQPAQPAQQPVPQEQPSRKKPKKDYQHDPAEPGKSVQVKRRPYSKKQYSDGNHTEAPEKPGYIDENAPAELVMNFAELDSVPSETHLNKTFRRFGPLKESETEVDRVSSRARVVFKKCVDAEVACSSAKKFNIFGSILINYQLNYTISALFSASSVATTQDQEMHLDLSNYEENMV